MRNSDHLKIAYLINQYPAVSHSFIRREIQALERRGLEVLRFSARPSGDLVDVADKEEASRTRVLLASGWAVLAMATLGAVVQHPRRFAKALRVAASMARQSDGGFLRHMIYLAEACLLGRWLQDAGVTHLHAHFGTNPAAVARLVSVLYLYPYSFTVHGPEEFDKPGALSLGAKIDDAAFVTGVSHFGTSQLRRWCSHTSWTKIHVVRCGVDQAFFEGQVPANGQEQSPVPAPSGEPRLVCVGRLCEQKGQLLLLEACARLWQAGTRFELVLVGDGPMRQDVERLAVTLGIQKAVTITGWQDTPQVQSWVRSARVMVLPSFAEGLPVAIMEALALRIPVITTCIAGIPELVDASCGWLVPAGSVEALAEAINTCLQLAPDRLTAMGEAGRQRVAALHMIDRAVAPLADLFMRGRLS
jgi:glycosyltransferase involved in cell wall biosynthesis